jgi:hypothetical protein
MRNAFRAILPTDIVMTQLWLGMISALCMMLSGCKTMTPASEIETTVGAPRSGLESAPGYSVHLAFRNTSTVGCMCRRYRLDWQGGQKDVHPDVAFLIPAKGAVERSLAIGYLTDLKTFERTATVTVFCGRR